MMQLTVAYECAMVYHSSPQINTLNFLAILGVRSHIFLADSVWVS